MYESNNVEYLDCCNSSAHVGHCHPQVEQAAPFSSKHKVLKCQFQVVGKGQQQMGKLVTAQGFISENLRKYVKVVLVKQKDIQFCFKPEPGGLSSGISVRLLLHHLRPGGERPGDASCQTIHRGNRYHGGRGGAPRKYWHYARHQSKDAQQVRFFFLCFS